MEFEPNNIFDDRYELKELLGRGSFGEVWLSYDKVARIDVAIKIYIALDNRGLEDFRNEYRSVYDIQHPNILTPTHFDVWNNRPYLVMHYCPVSCDRKIGEMTEEEIWKFIADVSGGLSYLHEQDIIHRDIKPDNILQDSSGRYVLTDFGLSKKMRSSLRRNSTRAQHQEEASGSLSYMGPELFEAKPEAVKATDIWALGVTVYEMLVGELPFMGQGGIMLKNGAEIPELPERYSYGLRKLVRDCLQKNPWDRPTAPQLISYKGLKKQPKRRSFKRVLKSRTGKIALALCSIIFCSLLSVALYKYFVTPKSLLELRAYNKLIAKEARSASPKFGIGTDGQGNDTADNNVQLQPGYVDLGLSVKWAECNLGASKPEKYGGYYQWAGTEDVSDKSVNLYWDNCPYHTGFDEYSGWSKYNTKSSYGAVDNKTTLEPSDDAATVKLGGTWRMPTDAEWKELKDNCTWTWTTLNGVKGYKVQSKKTGYTDNWIFLPAAGCRSYDNLDDVGSLGDYWSSSLTTDRPDGAFRVHFNSDDVHRYRSYRCRGHSVRPVYDDRPGVTGVTLNLNSMKLNKGDTGTLSATVSPIGANPYVIWASSDETVAKVSATGVVTAMAKGVATITATTISGVYTASCKVKVEDIIVGAVDLGLSVKWAECNLGATQPEEYGGYYQWAGTEDVSNKSIYLDVDNCPYHTGSSYFSGWTKYNKLSSYGTVDNKVTLEASDDAATVGLGNTWRIPTDAEWKELIDNCIWTWTTLNGVKGYKVQSKKTGFTDNWIFLPAAGCRSGNGLYYVGLYGRYWSSSLRTDFSTYAYYVEFSSDKVVREYGYRDYGRPVRPVSE